ncbi:MAG TPA: hypothetical protein VD996_02525 [Chitinophagaceae bacterium]|nr:hypothetical protein [Chitinophagaceae bacterium]
METIYLVKMSRDKDIPQTKTCRCGCGQTRPLKEFTRETAHRDGRGSILKVCANKRQVERNREKRMERERWAMI